MSSAWLQAVNNYVRTYRLTLTDADLALLEQWPATFKSFFEMQICARKKNYVKMFQIWSYPMR